MNKQIIQDIESFLSQSSNSFNEDHVINFEEYFKLMSKLSSLDVKDFINIEKYELYLKFINNNHNKIRRQMFESEFKEHKLSDFSFVSMSNYLLEILDKIK